MPREQSPSFVELPGITILQAAHHAKAIGYTVRRNGSQKALRHGHRIQSALVVQGPGLRILLYVQYEYAAVGNKTMLGTLLVQALENWAEVRGWAQNNSIEFGDPQPL